MEFENKKLRDVADIAARIMMGEKVLHPNQQKLDVHEPEKDELTAHDFKKLRSMKKEETMHEESCECGDCPSDKDMKKEEVDLDEGKMGQLSADLTDLSHEDFHKEYGKPKSHFDPTNFKKPVQPGKEMDRAKSLAQRGMASMKKEAVESPEEMKVHSSDGKHIGTITHGKYQSVAYAHPNSKFGGSKEPRDDEDSMILKGPQDNQKGVDFIKAHHKEMKESVELDEMFPGTPEYEKKYGKAPQDMKPGEKKKTTKGEMEKTGKGVVHRRKFSEMVESYSDGGIKGLFKTLAEEPTNAEFTAQLDDAKKRAAGTKKQPEVSKPAVQAVQNEEVELTLEDFTVQELEQYMKTEDYEQLDELSKVTLGAYIKKSKGSAIGSSQVMGMGSGVTGQKSQNKAERTVQKRAAGINRAVDRLTNEKVESFEEQTHTTVEFIDYNDVNGVKYAEIDLRERSMTASEKDKKEEIVKSMKKGLSGFKERYGDRAKEVMYATATKQAMKD